ncbi:uncharacterized protein LOC142318507 [Lycorma delicatula]|uniref:uncharacterized protein LOC142318507 n=1 Tax=Lycorma delicatula TaxID=130591 RepID=UPI003F51457A
MPNPDDEIGNKMLTTDFETQMKQNRCKRGTFKGSITRIKTFVESLDSEKPDLDLVKVKLDHLETTWHKYDEVQTLLELNHETTAIVGVKDSQKTLQSCRVLLDAGSQANFITEDTVQQPINTSTWNIPKFVKLADYHFNTPGNIDILIGSELYLHLMKKGQIKKTENFPVIQETTLGWIVAGKLPSTDENENPPKITSLFINSELNIQNQLKQFWELEEIKTTPRTKEESMCEQHFLENLKRNQDGRFIVRLPRRQNHTTLGDSFDNAHCRFLLLERKLNKVTNLKEDYSNFMKRYLELDHMQVIEQPTRNDALTCNDAFERPYYLPHHAVFKQTSSTTKLRVVFDASAKADNGISLNDTLIVGPTVQQDLISIVLRFRTHVYAMTADIAKMYRQVLVDPRDYDLQRIIWRNSVEEEIGHYQLKTIAYGTASAPFFATRCIIQLANENSKQFPKASEVIRHDFYVDDLQTGADDLTETMQLQDGYGACIYLRSVNTFGNISVKLLCSKSRVAPVKQISIPRLELCGALLMARLLNFVNLALKLTINKIYLWTDSTVVLSWISALPTKWKTFVANRVSEIQDLTDGCVWGHVSTDENPADVLSRGNDAFELQINQLWWYGPSWLNKPSEYWNHKPFDETNLKAEIVQLNFAMYLLHLR